MTAPCVYKVDAYNSEITFSYLYLFQQQFRMFSYPLTKKKKKKYGTFYVDDNVLKSE